jgi:putative ABC transport system permease protein
MVPNYFLVAWQNIVRNRVFSIINVMGLPIGLAARFLIYQYVRFELSYDTFHKNSDRICRVPISYSGSFASVPQPADPFLHRPAPHLPKNHPFAI